MTKFNNTPNKLVTDTEGNKHWISPSISVDGLVIVDNHVLVVKRSEAMSNPLLWCLPCGFMDWNETPLDACIREVYEEAGIDVREHDMLNADYHRPHSINGTALQFIFRLSEFPKLNLDMDECVEYKWVGLDELDELEFAFGHERLIRELV